MAPHIDRARELIREVEEYPNVSQETARELAAILSRLINHEK